MSTELQTIGTMSDLKTSLSTVYAGQLKSFLKDEKAVKEFIFSVVGSVQRNPALLECEPTSFYNAFMMIAQMKFMPSDVSGEAYVLPYNNSKKVGKDWIKVKEAQFQLGYQGIVTLFYRAGAKEIVSEIVYAKDNFSFTNGKISHEADPFDDDRGEIRGVYVIIRLATGGSIEYMMSSKKILAHAARFSKSFKSKHTPWDAANDPELWMWKKTVLKQAAKLAPKNSEIYNIIAEDNKDSVISDRMVDAKAKAESMRMGNLQVNKDDGKEKDNSKKAPIDAEITDSQEG